MGKGWMPMLAAMLWLASAGQVHAQGQVDLEQYLKRDDYGRIKISPDGLYYAATLDLEDRGALVIIRRSDKKVVGGSAGVKDSVIDDFWWAKDDRVVLSTAERFGSRDQPYPTGKLFAVGVDGSRVKTLVGPKVEAGLVDTYGGNEAWEMASLARGEAGCVHRPPRPRGERTGAACELRDRYCRLRPLRRRRAR
jgi:hypothetical protein